MHPHLVQEKEIACREFVEALHACHADWVKKLTGGCNDIKRELNNCLRKERVDRTNKNREEAKAKKALIAEKMRRWEVNEDSVGQGKAPEK
ncbi:UPF0287-domain-containing protein [Serendipita vermifera]|nr:UPF0287-domain-containing protein [Serendipita vermifera]